MPGALLDGLAWRLLDIPAANQSSETGDFRSGTCPIVDEWF